MKKFVSAAGIVSFIGSATAHGGKEGVHHQEQNILGSTDPIALIFTLGMTFLGLFLVAISVRKYRNDSS